MPPRPEDVTAAQQEILARLRGLGKDDALIARMRDETLAKLARPGLFSMDQVGELISRADRGLAKAVEKHILGSAQPVELRGERLFRLKDDVRAELLRENGLGILERGVEAAGWDDFERLFEKICESGTISNDDVAEYGAEFSIRIASILGSENFASASRLRSIARLQRRTKASLSTKHRLFVGREEELNAAHEYLVRNADPRVLQIHGAAGAGKTTLIKKALNPFYDDPNNVIAEVDFERPVNDQNLVSFVGREILFALYDSEVISDRQLATLEKEVNRTFDLHLLIALLRKHMLAVAHQGGRVLLFFDSVEIYVSAFNDPLPLMGLIEAFVEEFDSCKVVLATRLSTFEFRVPLQTVHLDPLTDQQVRQYCAKSNLSPAATLFVLRSLPERNPLLLTLLVEAVKRERSLSFDDLKHGPLNDVLFQRYVIERIIDKLPRFRTREIARAALPLRRITPELLTDGDILPGFSTHRDLNPVDIFKELEQQILFFESGEDGIFIRQDIRGLLLKLGFASDEKVLLTRTRRRALEFYLAKLKSGDEGARKEALYYALCLNSERALLEEIWSPEEGNELLKYLEDFTPRSRSWLKHKLQRRWRVSDFSDAFPDDAEPESVNFVFNAFNAGRADSIERLMLTRSLFKSSSYSAIFADAMVDLAALKYESALSKITFAAIRAPSGASHQILQQGLRVAAISNVDAGELIDQTRRVYFELESKGGGENRWLASYYSLWIARLVPQLGELHREVSKVKAMLESVEPRNLGRRSKLTDMQINDICLLGSAEDPEFATYWMHAVNPKKLAPSSLRHVFSYLRQQHRDVIPSSVLAGLAKSSPQAAPIARKYWESALSAFVKTKSLDVRGDVTPLRHAMLIYASDILLGLLIASIERTSSTTDVSERELVRRLLNRTVTGGENVSSIVAASVRQIARNGDLYGAIIDQRDDFEIRKALTNWLRFFRVDVDAVLPDRNTEHL